MSTHQMIGSKLAYLKMMKEHAEKTASSSDEAKQETIKYFETKIQELETDVGGPPRYSYNLRYPTDFGREANGVKPEFAHKQFSNTREIVHFIEMLILRDDMLFISDTYNIPSPSKIDVMLSGDSRITRTKIDINADEEEDDIVPPFEITRTRIN
jgi:hypothetical protein